MEASIVWVIEQLFQEGWKSYGLCSRTEFHGERVLKDLQVKYQHDEFRLVPYVKNQHQEGGDAQG